MNVPLKFSRDQKVGLVQDILNYCCSLEVSQEELERIKIVDIRDFVLKKLVDQVGLNSLGTTFSKRGESGIYLPLPGLGEKTIFQGNFIFWSDIDSYHQVIDDALHFLADEDSIGLIAVFNKTEQDFTALLQKIESSITTSESFVTDSLVSGKSQHYISRHRLPGEGQKEAVFHHIVFNHISLKESVSTWEF